MAGAMIAETTKPWVRVFVVPEGGSDDRWDGRYSLLLRGYQPAKLGTAESGRRARPSALRWRVRLRASRRHSDSMSTGCSRARSWKATRCNRSTRHWLVENGGEKVGHGSGGMSLLRAAQ